MTYRVTAMNIITHHYVSVYRLYNLHSRTGYWNGYYSELYTALPRLCHSTPGYVLALRTKIE